MYTYWQVFKQAFKIAWQNPGLWLFGLFTALLGSAGGLELIMSGYGFGGQGIIVSFWQGLVEGGLFTVAGFHGFTKILSTNPFYLFVIILFALAAIGITVLVLWFSIISQSALIGQAISISKSKSLNWRESFDLGLTKFWKVLFLNLLGQAVVWTLLFVISFFGILSPTNSISIILTFIFETLAVGLAFAFLLILSFVVKFAVCGAVLKDWSFKETINQSIKLFFQNWLLGLEIAVVLFAINLAVNAISVYLLSWLFFFAVKLYAAFYFGLVFIFLLLLVTFLLIQILLVIFHWSVWAIIFELASNKKLAIRSFIARIFQKKML
ncbi:MAG: hypothetical protein WCW26_00995 [Candidatus Buchananbacteria bacterium]